MQENKIKLIAIDLDGTLLNRKGQIDEPTAKAVRKATKQGTVIVISTGRPIEEVPEEQLNGIGVRYVVALNGAAVYKMPEGKCICQRPMPAELASALIDELSALEVYPDVFAAQKEYGLSAAFRYPELYSYTQFLYPQSAALHPAAEHGYPEDLRQLHPDQRRQCPGL